MQAIKPARTVFARRLAYVLLGGVLAAADARAGSGIDLEVTVGTDLAPNACAGTSSLEAVFGDELNFCYRVTNHTAAALDYHAASDSADGDLLAPGTPHSIAPGETWQYNRIARATAAGSHTTTWTAQAAQPSYTAQARAGAFVDISASPSAIALDAQMVVGIYYGGLDFRMPFAFDFYGIRTDRLCITPNGIVGVAQEDCRFPGDNNAVGAPPAERIGMALMPLWDSFEAWPDGQPCRDLCRFIYGALYADTLGSAPNRKFVLQWHKRIHTPITMNADGASFEIVFDEASGGFAFEYGDLAYTATANINGDPPICDRGACATIGVQADAHNASVFSYQQTVLAARSGIDWTSNAAYRASAAVNLTLGKPVLGAAPTAAFALAPGAQSTVRLSLANPGDHELAWTLGQPDSGSATPVAAFGVRTGLFDLTENNFVRADIAAATPATILSTISGGYGGGTFVDGDFSEEYVTRGYDTAADDMPVQTREFLQTIDTATGAVATVGATGIGEVPGEIVQVYSLAWDATSNTLYALVQRDTGRLSDTGSYLVSLDRYTGAATWLGRLTLDQAALEFGVDYVIGIAIDSQGHMFGLANKLDDDGTNLGFLLRIDADTFSAHAIGALGPDAPFILGRGVIAFDPRDDRLYMNGINLDDGTTWLYRIDTTTGVSTGIASIADPIAINAFAIAGARGPCVQPEQVPWLTPAASAGDVAAGGSGEIALALDASALTAGRYETTLCLRSNDPYRHLLPLRVRLEVGLDSIFHDGFDGAPAP